MPAASANCAASRNRRSAASCCATSASADIVCGVLGGFVCFSEVLQVDSRASVEKFGLMGGQWGFSEVFWVIRKL